MPNTTTRQYPYPTPTDPSDVPYWLQTALEKIDADMNAVTPGAPSWTDLDGYASGWSAYTGFGWLGLKVVRRGRFVTISGAIQKSAAWGANDRILTITDTSLRPAVPMQAAGASVQLRANGEMYALTSGSGAIAVSFGYPV